METIPKPRILGDQPKSDLEHDEFGLATLVTAISELLADRTLPPGYIVGLEGSWGSGKSTITEFVKTEISKKFLGASVVHIHPWELGNKSNFAPFLMGEISKGILNYSERHKSKFDKLTATTIEGIAAGTRQLSRFLIALGKTTDVVATVDPTSTTKLAALGLKKSGNWLRAKLETKELTYSELRKKIFDDLNQLQKKLKDLRVIVLVDDTDRLEPAEAAEVVRLIREIGNFPLVSYLMCFDETILQRQIRVALRLPTKHNYLDKIFNQIISVPPQEPFALRRYFSRLLRETFETEFEKIGNADESRDLRNHQVVDVWAGRLLKSPRDVIRAVDAVAFGWSHVPKGADFWDYCWLMILRTKSPNLYRLIREYLSEIGAYRDGGRPSDGDAKEYAVNLKSLLAEAGWKDPYHSGIDSFIPGVAESLIDKNVSELFKFSGGELEKFEQQSRLGSPSHWRMYFAFDLPSYAVPDTDISKFRDACKNNVVLAKEILIRQAQADASTSSNTLEVLLERLSDLPDGALSRAELNGLASVMSDTIDQISTIKSVDVDGFGGLWPVADRLLYRTESKNFPKLARTGKALGWLSHIVRSQGFSHGKPEPSRADDSRKWLTLQQLEQATNSLLQRFKRAKIVGLANSASAMDIFYLWLQLGSEEELKVKIARETKQDADFLIFLEAMRGLRYSSTKGKTRPLQKQVVEAFLDATKAHARLTKISIKGTTNSSKAKELLRNWIEERY